MEKEERVKYSEGQVHEAMVRLRGEGLTPEGLQKIVDNKELAEQIVSMVEKIVEKTRVPVLTTELKKEYKIEIMNVVLPVGTLLEVYGNRRLKKYRSNFSIDFLVKAVPLDNNDPEWITSRISWEDVKHPKVCTFVVGGENIFNMPPILLEDGVFVSTTNRMFLAFIYCATHDDFIDIEPNRPDVKYCPLCGQKV